MVSPWLEVKTIQLTENTNDKCDHNLKYNGLYALEAISFVIKITSYKMWVWVCECEYVWRVERERENTLPKTRNENEKQS